MSRLVFFMVVLLGGAQAWAGQGGDPYELAPEIRSADGGGADVVLTIRATRGYKWNKDFPFRLKIDGSAERFGGSSFSRADVELSDGDRTATVRIGRTEGPFSGTLKGKVSFSVCTKKMCKVFMNREVVWKAAPASKARPQ